MKACIVPGNIRNLKALLGIIAVVFTVSGCGSSTEVSKTDEAQMRSAMTKKRPVNLSELPKDQQEKIKQFFQKPGNVPGAPAAGAPPR